MFITFQIHEWRKMGSIKPLNLVELGPGHATLMQDILKTIQKLVPQELEHISVHLVETSPTLTKIQEARLCGYFHNKPEKSQNDEKAVHEAISKQGPRVTWYSRVADVPKGFSFFVANEFFDALPIHQFVKNPKSKVWEEILIDLNIEKDALHFVKSPSRGLNNQFVENDNAYRDMEMVEISPRSGVTIETISERITQYGGSSLIIDYGYSAQCDNDQSNKDEKVRNTFRAFLKHKLHDPLKDIGQADLTADVDFDYLIRKSGPHVATYGPVTQRQFLTQLGIEVRCNLLKENNPKIAEELSKSLDLLISPEGMGHRFKFLCMFPKTMHEIHSIHPPAGFH